MPGFQLRVHHLLLCIIVALTLIPMSVHSDSPNKRQTQPVKLTTGKPGKCWKRTWITSEAPFGKSVEPICVAYEKVLNTTRQPPEKVACYWPIPTGDKHFKKPEWRELDWREHWGLIGDINKAGVKEELREDIWKNDETKERQAFEEGRRKLSVTTVVMDGRPRQLVRYNISPCGTMYGVMLPETRRLDWKFRDVLLPVNADHYSDLIFYDGKPFFFGWDDVWEIVLTYDESVNICQFKYVKRR